MKKASLFFAKACIATLFLMTACQKDETESGAGATVQTWLLLETKWTATLTPNNAGETDLSLTSGSTVLSGQSVPVSSLPGAIVQKMASNGNPIPANATAWLLSNGSYILEFSVFPQEVNLFWIEPSAQIKTIGRIVA